MDINFAVNYSSVATELLDEKEIQVDYFKCPAWPDLVAAIEERYPLYVHFPLKVGAGLKDAVDSQTGHPVDWAKYEPLLAQTNTPFVNLHLTQTSRDYPEIPVDTTDPDHIEMLTERMLLDVEAVIRRFGPERVIVENVYSLGKKSGTMQAVILPDVIRRVVEETGCGFLLDASHARLAARQLGLDSRAYIKALPLAQTREIHITGIQVIDEHWVERFQNAGVEAGTIQKLQGQPLDHVPMTDQDWPFIAWLMAQVRQGACGQPWVVTLECGGVGGMWEALTDRAILAEQIPRLYRMVKG